MQIKIINFIKNNINYILGIFVSVIFVQSLYYKFTNSPETIYIFEEKLNIWAGTIGLVNYFAPHGLFSAVNVGILELIASTLILLGLII